MISLLSMIVNTITGALVYALKALFSMLVWFVKTFFKLLKLFFVALPVTSVFFTLLLLVNLLFMLTKASPATLPSSLGPQALQLLSKGSFNTITLFSMLDDWWFASLHTNENAASTFVMIIITVLMFVPVICVMLCISVFMSYGAVLFIGVVVDAALYLLLAVLGKSFISQAMGRYYRIFPEAGKKHEERQYDKWVRKRNREFEQEERARKRGAKAAFYDNEDDFDDDFEDDFEGDYEDEYDGDYEDDYEDEYEGDYEDDYEGRHNRRAIPPRSRRRRLNRRDYPDQYDDPDEYEELEDFEDREYDDPKRSPEPAPHAAFDFFAGCSSLESVDKKYKSLVKLYHPDNMDGDTAALQEINAQYAEVKKKYK